MLINSTVEMVTDLLPCLEANVVTPFYACVLSHHLYVAVVKNTASAPLAWDDKPLPCYQRIFNLNHDKGPQTFTMRRGGGGSELERDGRACLDGHTAREVERSLTLDVWRLRQLRHSVIGWEPGSLDRG